MCFAFNLAVGRAFLTIDDLGLHAGWGGREVAWTQPVWMGRRLRPSYDSGMATGGLNAGRFGRGPQLARPLGNNGQVVWRITRLPRDESIVAAAKDTRPPPSIEARGFLLLRAGWAGAAINPPSR